MEKTREPDLDAVRRWIVEELDDAKAANILELDIRLLTQIADWMVVASGTSSRHVLALAERLRKAGARHGLKPAGVEGESDGEWVLLDFGDLIVHLMLPATREFYDLEGLWNERLGAQLTQARERQGKG
ncbi:MAG TPA: ribosome silencing factor [Gammaproteobacteria bacterium]|nr:ribosome silencing factor [Acidiferrobacteraceae bacterium]MDP6551899.1 ribosome silencing factor [Arenicellales bacterium]MDP6791376.1 ribosome silencing factor [Arenicellales bacterium]MDP6919303.1 ribosome silencing factor [Arenicellales bacterium]HCX88229.1 ribosome silencing factor [Gammaproteobacteria bacterium]|tara:strand:- start:975 stop:1361 length:387 start_codon:yes stop_codon:yes gene_type:complete